MKEEIKRAIESCKARIDEEENRRKEAYLRALGIPRDPTGIGDWKNGKTEEYCHKVGGVYYKEVRQPVEVTDEELKELYSIIPPEKVLTPEDKELKISRTLRKWGNFLMALSIIAFISLLIVGIAEMEEILYVSIGLGCFLFFFTIRVTLRGIAQIIDSLNTN